MYLDTCSVIRWLLGGIGASLFQLVEFLVQYGDLAQNMRQIIGYMLFVVQDGARVFCMLVMYERQCSYSVQTIQKQHE